MNINFKKTYTNSKSPTRGSTSAACYDLYVSDTKVLNPETVEYNTGVCLEIPDGYCGLLFPRSSISNYHQSFCNSVGVIDSDYRGEVKVRVYKNDDSFEYYKTGERCCQLMIIPVTPVEYTEVKELTESKRDKGGFGSSGK